ncbi:MAG: asparagine synthase (glutamine-hydrolyzing), partial [Gammaproteobacteria bacterium]|nr:asparagine synthase (glutamine-hydrolyzing) [Gammaproteobacteria bacterium]
MCGIVGQIHYGEYSRPEAERRALSMVRSLHHRGPDAEGVMHSGPAVFGHARLKIVDLSDSANQPMSNASCMLVFNGEIYNYKELREELSGHYAFETSSDTEVILAAYQQWGEECFSRFNGDWALAIFDGSRQRLLLARDRFGIKPIYFHQAETSLLFASEISALVAGGVIPEISRDALLMAMRLRKNEFHDRTLASNIHVVRPGCFMTVDADGRSTEHRYYDDSILAGGGQAASSHDLLEQFDHLLVDAVALRYRADVPVGVCLSGGLDSTCIVAAARRAGKEVVTFSAGFPGEAADESEYFNAVNAHFGNEAVVRTSYPAGNILDSFETLVHQQDAPQGSLDTLGRCFVLDDAARQVKVVLDGQGGDEIFGGYGACYNLSRQMADERGLVPLDIDLYNRNVHKNRENPDFNAWFG